MSDVKVLKINYVKAVFLEEHFVSQPQFESASMLTALYLKPSIISRESMHKHNFGQTLNLKSVVVTMNIRSRLLKSN